MWKIINPGINHIIRENDEHTEKHNIQIILEFLFHDIETPWLWLKPEKGINSPLFYWIFKSLKDLMNTPQYK